MGFKSQIITGLGWTAGSRLLAQIVAWGVTIFVMRILTPADYGLLAMATSLIALLALFSEMGIGSAVVQARNVDREILRRVFGLALIVNSALFTLMALLAPLVSRFYGNNQLTEIIQVIAIQFLLLTLTVIPDAQLQRRLEFKWRSLLELSSSVVQAASTLVLALKGFGVWSLVFGSLIAVVWRVVGINILSPFPYLPSFAFRGLERLYAFGGYVVLARLMGTVTTQADIIIGGRVLGQEQIGYYSVSMELATLPMNRAAAILNTVAFPAVAAIGEDKKRVSNHFLKGIWLLSLVSFPAFWGMASVAPDIVKVLLGAKWEPAILPLQLLAIVMPLRMIWQMMPAALLGMGMGRLVAGNHFVLFGGMIASFLIGVQFGITGLCGAWLLAFPLIFAVNLRLWLPALDVNIRQFLGSAKVPILASIGMCISVTSARTLGLSGGLSGLLVLIAVGATSYMAIVWTLDRSVLRSVRSILKQ